MRRTTAGGGLRERLVSTIGAGILGLGIALGLLLASLIQMMLQGSALARVPARGDAGDGARPGRGVQCDLREQVGGWGRTSKKASKEK